MSTERYGAIIGILGTTGSGKTTLAHRLGDALKATVLQESADGNPFIASAHGAAPEILQNQLWFLIKGRERWKRAADIADAGGIAILEAFGPWIDIHSKMTLSRPEYRLYHSISQEFSEGLPEPNPTIILHDSLTFIQNRLKNRNLPYDQTVTEEFLRRLDRFHRAWAIPRKNTVIWVTARDMEDPRKETALFQQIRTRIGL